MNKHTRHQGSLIEEAQRWQRALKQAGPDEQAAFAAWIKRSPRHLEAYLRHLAIETELQGLEQNDGLEVETLLAKASANVIPLTSNVAQTHPDVPSDLERGQPGRLLAAVAASAVLAICLIVAEPLSYPQSIEYTTDTGEQRRIVLPDRSSIELNTQSHIRVSIRRAYREVELLAGEALFTVQHDAKRPFRVRVADKVVEDLGTQFSIHLKPDASTTVSALNGRVQILTAPGGSGRTSATAPSSTAANSVPGGSAASTQLSAGEQAHIAGDGRLIKRTTINVAETASWREHRLWFNGATLPEVAAEFNRYNKRQFHIGNDPAIVHRRYTATFDAYDPDSFLQALQDDPTLVVQASETEVLIRGR